MVIHVHGKLTHIDSYPQKTSSLLLPHERGSLKTLAHRIHGV